MKKITITPNNLDDVLPAVNYFLSIQDVEQAIKLVRAMMGFAPGHPSVQAAKAAVSGNLSLKYADFLDDGGLTLDIVGLYAGAAEKKVRIDKEIPGFSDLARNIITEKRTLLGYDRLYTIYQSLQNTARLGGDIVELGVYRGGSLKFIAETCAMSHIPAKIYGLDTFTGHIGVHAHDGDASAGVHSDGMFKGDGMQAVSNYLAGHDNVHLVAGDACVTLQAVMEQTARLAFAHVDMDIYAPTAHALPLLARKLAAGGAILLDDYGFLSCPGAKKATDEFLAQHPGFFKLHLLTGQCLLLKPG